MYSRGSKFGLYDILEVVEKEDGGPTTYLVSQCMCIRNLSPSLKAIQRDTPTWNVVCDMISSGRLVVLWQRWMKSMADIVGFVFL